MSKVKYAGCFDGEVTHGCILVHVVALDECQRNALQKLEGHAAVLKNCHTQLSTYNFWIAQAIYRTARTAAIYRMSM